MGICPSSLEGNLVDIIYIMYSRRNPAPSTGMRALSLELEAATRRAKRNPLAGEDYFKT